jgi:hypothetical protein
MGCAAGIRGSAPFRNLNMEKGGRREKEGRSGNYILLKLLSILRDPLAIAKMITPIPLAILASEPHFPDRLSPIHPIPLFL